MTLWSIAHNPDRQARRQNAVRRWLGHRFEDLIRQLVYDFKQWVSLEAVGRLGADEGIDIRGTEILTDGGTIVEVADAAEEGQPVEVDFGDRQEWLFQCKRERMITPSKIGKIVENDLSQKGTAPYAYVLVAACDFSKATRDVFRRSVTSYGVQEFHLWGKAELEDMLILPKEVVGAESLRIRPMFGCVSLTDGRYYGSLFGWNW